MKDFDKYRRKGAYHWKYLKTQPDYRRRVEAVCELVRPGFRCLDLGCGDGAYLYRVSKLCAHAVGVDADETAIRLARQELDRREVKNCTLVHSTLAGVAGRLPPSIRRYELIYCMDCIEHLDDPREALDVMERYLARDGVAILGTPLFVEESEVSPYHVKEYTRTELEALLEPRFRKVSESLLPAPLPVKGGLVDRFYVYCGRRRPWWSRMGRRRRAVTRKAPPR